MSKRTAGLAISYAVDEPSSSDDEDDLVPSNAATAAKKAKPKAAKGIEQPKEDDKSTAAPPKTKQRKRRASGGTAAAEKAPAKSKRAGVTAERPALKDIPNKQAANESDGVDEFDLEPDPSSRAMSTPMTATKTTAQRPKKPASDAKPKAARGRPKKQEDEVIPETQEEAHASSNFGRSTAMKKPPKLAKREIIPETQAEPMEIDKVVAEDRVQNPTPKVAKKPAQRKRSVSRQRQQSVPRKGAGSASDTERSDPALRRKLGDMTKKFEAVNVKYEQLRDVGIDEANSRFDQLKAQSDERIRAADKLIASLQNNLSVQTAQAADLSKLRAEMDGLTISNTAQATETKSLQTSLQSAQNEIKTLQAKLAASRSTSEQAVARGAPNSTVKGGAEAEKRVLKLKEDLYADLTGLIVRDVKRHEAECEDVYDCIQTGRNGTLRFALTILNPVPASTDPTSNPTTAYDDAEFAYEPVFDPAGNDRALVALLPDYLTEEICFPRRQAAKFYARIVDVLCVKRVEEEGMVDVGEAVVT